MPERDVDIEVDLDRIAWNLPHAPDRPQPAEPQPVKPSSLEKEGKAAEQQAA